MRYLWSATFRRWTSRLYDSTAFRSFLTGFTKELNDAWVPDTGMDAEEMEEVVKDDFNANREFWVSKRNKTLDGAQRWVYDLFLKSNNIPSGVKNYSEVVGLMMSLDYQAD